MHPIYCATSVGRHFAVSLVCVFMVSGEFRMGIDLSICSKQEIALGQVAMGMW